MWAFISSTILCLALLGDAKLNELFLQYAPDFLHKIIINLKSKKISFLAWTRPSLFPLKSTTLMTFHFINLIIKGLFGKRSHLNL